MTKRDDAAVRDAARMHQACVEYRQRADALKGDVDMRDQEIAELRQRAEKAEARMHEAQGKAEAWEVLLKKADANIDSLTEERDKAEREWDEARKSVDRFRERYGRMLDRLAEMTEALEFYADPDTWFATIIVGDPPCGGIVDDYSEIPIEGCARPGKRARAVLNVVPQGEPAPADDEARPWSVEKLVMALNTLSDEEVVQAINEDIAAVRRETKLRVRREERERGYQICRERAEMCKSGEAYSVISGAGYAILAQEPLGAIRARDDGGRGE